jgi:hypothetical protein
VKPQPPDLLKGVEPKEFILNLYKQGVRYSYYDLLSRGVIKLAGYEFDFKEHLKKYLYKQHGEWHEAYAPNKTLLRKSVYGTIDKIIELKD